LTVRCAHHYLDIFMAKLLHLQSSPRGNRSASIALANQFIASYQAAHPSDTVETLDLWQAQLPEFDGAALDAKYAVLNGQAHTAEQRAAWATVVAICEHFKAGFRKCSTPRSRSTRRCSLEV
jgi:FMN-dependent NADH-azoreductase